MLFQSVVYQFVSPLITGEFPKPELSIIDRHVGVLGTAVPETAVDENRDSLASKNKIGPTYQIHVTAPAEDAVLAKESCE